MTPNAEQRKQHAIELKLYGLQAHWHELTESQFSPLASWIEWELTERKQRGLARRLRNARIGRFKTLADFDWRWPEHIEQDAIHELMQLHFIADASNVISLAVMASVNPPSPRTWLTRG